MALGGRRAGAGHPTAAKQKVRASQGAELRKKIHADGDIYYQAGRDIATGYCRAALVKLNTAGAQLIGTTVGEEVEMRVYYIPPNAGMVQSMLELGWGKAGQAPAEVPDSNINVIVGIPGWREGNKETDGIRSEDEEV